MFRAGTPSSRSFRILNISWINLLASLAVKTLVGHKRVALCLAGLRALYPFSEVSSFGERQFLSSVKL